MDAEVYERVRVRLHEAGRREIAARFDQAAFGSWVITLDETPRLRIAWDGRDRSLMIQREVRDGTWRDAWVATGDADQTPESVLRAIAKA